MREMMQSLWELYDHTGKEQQAMFDDWRADIFQLLYLVGGFNPVKK